VVLLLSAYGALIKTEMKPNRGSLGLLIVIGVLNVIAFLSYDLGVTYGYTAMVAPVSAASPIITVSLALIFLKEKLALDQKIGILLVLVGIILLAV